MIDFIRRYYLHIIIAGISLYYATNYSLLEMLSAPDQEQVMRKQEEEAYRQAKAIEQEFMKRGVVTVDEMCSPTNECFLIVDRPFIEQDGVVVKRSLQVKGVDGIALGIAELTSPQGLTKAKFNTAKWPVNPLVIVPRYIKMMIASGFFLESLRHAYDKTQNVLMIGLGGGMASNFLAQLDFMKMNVTSVDIDPFMVEVASKWFGHETLKNNIVVIDDGVAFLEREKDSALKYNHVILDACYNSKVEVVCPIKQLAEAATVKNIAAVLKPGGTMAMNIFCWSNCDKYEEELMKTYSQYFESCFLLQYMPQRKVLLCAKKPNWTWKEEKARFKKNILEVDNMFEFQLYPFFEKM